MSMITEQVERLREQAELIRGDHYIVTYLDEAADTLEMLAAKVREDNAYQKAFEDIRAEIIEHAYPVKYDHNSIEKGMTITGIEQVFDKHNPGKGKEKHDT